MSPPRPIQKLSFWYSKNAHHIGWCSLRTYASGDDPRRSRRRRRRMSCSRRYRTTSKQGSGVQHASWRGVRPKSSLTCMEAPRDTRCFTSTPSPRRHAMCITDSPYCIQEGSRGRSEQKFGWRMKREKASKQRFISMLARELTLLQAFISLPSPCILVILAMSRSRTA